MKKFLKFSALTLSFITLSIPPSVAQEADFQGDGSFESPFIIEFESVFALLLQRMEKYESYTKGRYFALGRDIRVNAGVLGSDGSLSADSLRFRSWTPVGKESYGREFQGHFDGRGHTVSGIYINDPEGKNLGLFGVIAKEGEVRNLRLADSYICGNTYAGGIVGLCKGRVTECESSATVVAMGATHEAGGIAGTIQGDGVISKCINGGYVYGITYPDELGYAYNCSTGGIAGSGARVDSCENRGAVTAIGWGAAGGIAGSISGGKYIDGCVNRGSVTSESNDNVGGIVGTNWATVYNSRNYGEVSATRPGACIGGIAGRNSFNARVSGSENFVDINSDVDSVFVGGIVGNLDGGRQGNTYYTPKVFTSANHGSISTTSPKSQCGGVAGRSYCGEMHQCHNDGDVTSLGMAGGILPKGEFHTHIYESVNEGDISGLRSTGGIVGNINGEVRDSRNSGLVSTLEKNTDCGGIVGWLSGSSGIVRYCVNNGEVTSGMHVGGIVGNNESRSSVISSYNAGYVHSATEGSRLGGVSAGYGSLSNCYNAGTVQADAPRILIGGVTNNLWVSWDGHGNRSGSTAVNCYNSGDIIVGYPGCTVGNIAAVYEEYNKSFLFDNCYYLKGAIYGTGYLYADSLVNTDDIKNLKGIDSEDFATLAGSINKVDYPWDSKPYMQGRWRPLLVRNDYESAPEPMSYFDVLTSAGDTVYVDYGLPLGNEFFHTDSVGPALDAYNVAYEGAVRKGMLVDGADFLAAEGIQVANLRYIRHVSEGFNCAYLPFAVNPDDFPLSVEMSEPLRFEGDTLRLCQISNAAPFKPFLFEGGDMPGYWLCGQSDVTIVTATGAGDAGDPLIVGCASHLDNLPAGAYLLSADGLSLRRSSGSETMRPFRAYVSLPDTAPGTVGLAYDSNTTLVMDAVSRPVDNVFPDGLSVIVNTSSREIPVDIYSVNGMLVKSVMTHVGRNEIPVSIPGVYIVRLSGKSYKVMLH